MNFGDGFWRPKLRRIGMVPKGEEWRIFEPGLREQPGEAWYENVTMSLVERYQMAVGYGYGRQLQEAMAGCDVYTRYSGENFFRFVLTLPKPLAEILDDLKIQRQKRVYCFNPLFGPPPEFHGPLERNGLSTYDEWHAGHASEMKVQPSFGFIPHLPIIQGVELRPLPPPPEAFMDTLHMLVEQHPLDISGLEPE